MFSFRRKKKKIIVPHGREQHFPNIPSGDMQQTSPNEEEGSSLGSMISLNPAEISNSPKLRAVKLHRGKDGKFGVSLMRGGDKHFVEGPGLYPQDRLIEVNGENVEGASNDRIYELFDAGGSQLTLVVQGLPEMAEINSRISPDQRDSVMTSSTTSLTSVSSFRSEIQEEPWQNSRRVWYVHPEGVTAGTILPSTAVTNTNSSSVLLRLDNGNKMIEVDEYDTEPANPPKYDRAENLASLLHLNESCVLHTLRQRFGSNLIHTQAANILLLINPSRKLSVYNTKVMSMFRNMHYNKMPPHLYKTAKQAHLSMLATHTEQSIVLCGSTGSGKSTALHYIVHYYAQVHCNPKGGLPSEKFTAALALLDSFGCCLSESNTHSTRFTSLITLNFTSQGTLTGAQTYTCLLDRFRVVRCAEGELGYHIFYQMIEGSDDSLRRELQLGPRVTENNAFLPPLTEHGQRKQAAENYAKTLEAFKFLGGVSIPEVKGLLTLLSAILHLGRAGAVNHPNGMGARFANPTAAQICANVLGIKYDVFERQLISTLPLSGEADPAVLLQNAIEDLAMSLYELLFSAVNSLINRALAGPGRSPYSLVLADMPGFQNPARAASLQHLLMNYAAERLQSFFQNDTFNKILDLYDMEEINMNFCDIPASPQPIIDVLDRYYQGGGGLDIADTKGLYWILDEESMFPGATDTTFLERVLMHHSDAGGRGYRLIHQSGPSKFVMSHCNHTVNVEYDCTGWLQQARDTSASRYAKTIVSESNRQPVMQLFQGKGAGAITKGSPTPKSLADGTSTFMRQANSRKGHALLSSTSMKPQNRCLNYKFQLDYVFDTLKRTNPHFIHCLTPRSTRRPSDAVMDIVHMRAQLRSTGLLQAIRLYRQGFPDYQNFADFRRQFEVLRVQPFDCEGGDAEFDEREAVMTILEDCELDPSSYRTGISKVFFKSGVLATLQYEKEQKLNNFVIALQSLARGAIARKNMEDLTMKHSAVSVIQRNALIHAELHAWSWWKLFTRVKPLINVHSNKDIEQKETEMITWRNKAAKLEEQVTKLQEQNVDLTTKNEDLEAQIGEERENSAQVGGMYEREVVGRRNQENHIAEYKDKLESLQRDNEKLKQDVEEAKTTHIRSNESLAPSSGLGSEDDEQENSAQFWRQKYLQATADLETAKKSFEAEAVFAGDAARLSVKQIERKLQEVTDDKEHEETLSNNYKRSQQKLAEEIADLVVNLEQIQSRNSDLERKQKRFDQEMAKVNHNLKSETLLKEKMMKEKEGLQSDLISLKDKVREAESEAEESKRKLASVEYQLTDITALGLGSSTSEVVQLKKAKRDLEEKVDELEEELEETTSQMSSLQAAKTKWEMEAGSLRTQLSRDNDAKEEEIATLRETLTKRVSSLEAQLEDEYATSKTALKQKRELERKMAEIRDSFVDEDEVRRLRKQLGKAKALYRDAQTQLNSRQSSSVNKTQLNSLKSQVEDLQDALSAAQRAKRSAESELSEAADKLQSVELSKMDAENRISSLSKQVSDAQSRVEEVEEEMEEIERKHRLTSTELNTIKKNLVTSQTQEEQYRVRVGDCERQITDLQASLERAQRDTTDKTKLLSLENKVRELETEVDFEQSQKTRQDRAVKKLKDSLAESQDQLEAKRGSEMSMQSELRKVQRQLREATDAANDTDMKDVEWNKKRREYEEQIEELQYDKGKAEDHTKALQERLSQIQLGMDGDFSDRGSAEDINDDFLHDDDDLLDDGDIDLDLSDDSREPIRSLRRSPTFTRSPAERRGLRQSFDNNMAASRDTSVRNGVVPVSPPSPKETTRRGSRRRSRDNRTQKSISAADIAKARKLASEDDMR